MVFLSFLSHDCDNHHFSDSSISSMLGTIPKTCTGDIMLHIKKSKVDRKLRNVSAIIKLNITLITYIERIILSMEKKINLSVYQFKTLNSTMSRRCWNSNSVETPLPAIIPWPKYQFHLLRWMPVLFGELSKRKLCINPCVKKTCLPSNLRTSQPRKAIKAIRSSSSVQC